MLAQRLPGIMPSLSFEEALELTKLYSIAGLLGGGRNGDNSGHRIDSQSADQTRNGSNKRSGDRKSEDNQENSEHSSVYSSLPYSLVLERPFRSPHHSSSAKGLVGGGAYPKPGEISLSHMGILFLDELAEFPRSHLDLLRQPLESGSITISRAQHTLTFPASFLLVGGV